MKGEGDEHIGCQAICADVILGESGGSTMTQISQKSERKHWQNDLVYCGVKHREREGIMAAEDEQQHIGRQTETIDFLQRSAAFLVSMCCL